MLVLGGSGQVGLHALDGLVRAGHSVLAPTRRLSQGGVHVPSGRKGLSWLGVEPSEPACLPPPADLPGSAPQRLLSCGPLALALRWMEAIPGLHRVVAVSTSSVLSKIDSPSAAERQLVAGILNSEQRLTEACRQRGIELVLLRPSLIYGCGLDENLTRIYRWIQRWGVVPLATPADGLRQPLHVADLAKLLVRAMLDTERLSFSGEVVGGSTISYRQMVLAIFRAAGRPARIVPLPETALRVAVRLLRPLAPRALPSAAMIARQNQDLVFDDAATRQRYGFSPRPFEPGASDFRLAAELRQLLPLV